MFDSEKVMLTCQLAFAGAASAYRHRHTHAWNESWTRLCYAAVAVH